MLDRKEIEIINENQILLVFNFFFFQRPLPPFLPLIPFATRLLRRAAKAAAKAAAKGALAAEGGEELL